MHYIKYLLVIALVFIVCKLISNKKEDLAKAIEPCRVCGAAGKLNEDFFESHVSCTNPYCAMAGPNGKDANAAIFAWNNIPSMSTVVVWQFQAAGAALALQRLIAQGEALRNAQWLASVDRRFALSANEAGAEFDAALVIARKTLEAR